MQRSTLLLDRLVGAGKERRPHRDAKRHCAGAGIGKMLDTFHPLGVVTRIRFIKNRVCCAVWPAVPIVKMIGTWTWATPAPGKAILKFDASGSSRHTP